MMRAASLLLSLALFGCMESGGRADRAAARHVDGLVAPAARDNETTTLFKLVGKNAIWNPVDRIRMQGWETFHTQGLVKIEDTFYVSAVEVIERTVRNGTTTDALYDFSIDRSAGVGRGWLFKFDASGRLLGKVELTDASIYHPGGIDFDGRHIWVPVAEYRPNSRSNIYRVDPETLQAELAFSERDHIGGVVYNRARGSIHGVSWGSRRFYVWRLANRPEAPPQVVSSSWAPNPAFHIDYQDCHYQGVEYMLCAGIGGYSTPLGPIAYGGLELVDLRSGQPAHQVPVNLFVDEGTGPNPALALTHNAFWLAARDQRSLDAYFMTETNNQADLLVYQAVPWVFR